MIETYWKNALLHKSLGTKEKNIKNQNNERLELLGDAVLDLIVAEYLYKNYKSASEGTIAKLKAMIVSEPILAKISRQNRSWKIPYVEQRRSDVRWKK